MKLLNDDVDQTANNLLYSQLIPASKREDFKDRLIMYLITRASAPKSSEIFDPVDSDLQFLWPSSQTIQDIISFCISTNILVDFVEALFVYDTCDVFLDVALEDMKQESLSNDWKVAMLSICSHLVIHHDDDIMRKLKLLLATLPQASGAELTYHQNQALLPFLHNLHLLMGEMEGSSSNLHNINLYALLHVEKEVSAINLKCVPSDGYLNTEHKLLVRKERSNLSTVATTMVQEIVSTLPDSSTTREFTSVVADINKLSASPHISNDDSNQVMTFEKAADIVTSCMHDYNEAGEFIINRMLTHSTDVGMLDRCLNVLEDNMTALINPQSLQLMFDVISQLVLNHINQASDELLACLNRARNLCDIAMHKLSLTSKIILFDYNIKLHGQLSNYIEYDPVKKGIMSKIPSEFGKKDVHSMLNQLAVLTGLNEDFMDKVVILACIYPYETLNLLLNHIMMNEKDFKTTSFLFCRLNSFFLLQFRGGINSFLEITMNIGLDWYQRDEVQQENFNNESYARLNKVISLYKSIFSSLKSMDLIGVGENLVHELYLKYMKKCFDVKGLHSTKLLLDAASTMFIEFFVVEGESMPFVDDVKELFLLIYIVARFIDENEYSDSMQAKFQNMSVFLSEQIMAIESIDHQLLASLYQWLSRGLSSLDWTTQLCYLDLYVDNRYYKHCFPLPLSLKVLCEMPAGCEIQFEDISAVFPVTNWLRTVIKSPKVFPCTSLADNVSDANRSSFVAGLMLALMQVLPNSSESQWLSVHSCLETLILLEMISIPVDLNVFGGELPAEEDLTCCMSTLQLVGIYTQFIEKIYDVNCGIVLIPSREDSFLIQWRKTMKETLDKFRHRNGDNSNLLIFGCCHVLLSLCNTHDSLQGDVIKLKLLPLIGDVIQDLKHLRTNAPCEAKASIDEQLARYDKLLLLRFASISNYLVQSFENVTFDEEPTAEPTKTKETSGTSDLTETTKAPEAKTSDTATEANNA